MQITYLLKDKDTKEEIIVNVKGSLPQIYKMAALLQNLYIIEDQLDKE